MHAPGAAGTTTVFLSSTSKDLLPYRDAVHAAIGRMDGFRCVRMEDFGARDWEADDFCRARVKECGAFVGLLGHCRGSSPPGRQQSFSEREYEAAQAEKVPRLMFLADEALPVPAALREPDELWRRQRDFRERVRRERVVATFGDPLQLASQVVTALSNLGGPGRPAEGGADAQPARVVGGELVVVVPRRSLLVAGALYVYVARGTFPMGSDDGYEHERPRHRVSLSPFFLKATPVTNDEFAAFVGATGYVTTSEVSGAALCLDEGRWRPRPHADYRRPAGPGSSLEGKSDHPAVQVSWFDALEYCRFWSERSGLRLELPSEAQWEYAAAGPAGRRWAFGDEYAPGKANLASDGTTAVGHFAADERGLQDMTGNVYEWCADWYAPYWKDAGHEVDGVTRDPSGPRLGRRRVLRGGSWFDTPQDGRCANRYAGEPTYSAANVGFRPCLPLDDELLVKLVTSRRWGLTPQQMLGEGE